MKIITYILTTTLSVLLLTQTGYAQVCESYLSAVVIDDNTVVSLENMRPVLSNIENTNPQDIFNFDQAFLTRIADELRNDRDFIKKLSQNDVKIIKQVFVRYEDQINLTSVEKLTYAVVLFNLKDDSKRTQKAIQKIREIPKAVQYRFNRLLDHLAEFLIATNVEESLDAAIRIKALMRSRVQ
jgi:hypothetical protein